MRKVLIFILIAVFTASVYSQNQNDSIAQILSEQKDRINALDERVLVNESDLSKLTKIKLSGYVQAQWDISQMDLVKKNDPDNNFYIRRARIKVSYEAADGLKFVLQPDFTLSGVTVKDAYSVVSLPKLKTLSLWMGQFNRTNYEVEYSSSQREILERSRVIRNIYPSEREIGAKLEYKPNAIPLKAQLSVLNGNFGYSSSYAKDIDSKKDLMARVVYSVNMPGSGIGLDLGAHAYYGGMMAKTIWVSNYENQIDSSLTNNGKYFDKKWAGAEAQIYFDILGGMSLKGEYIMGKNAYIGGTTKAEPFKIRNFSGYYIYFIKNIGVKNQFVTRYDYFDPNTKLSGNSASSDVFYKTLSVAWLCYVNENIRIALNYEMPVNETSTKVTKDLKDNIFGVRVQAKF